MKSIMIVLLVIILPVLNPCTLSADDGISQGRKFNEGQSPAMSPNAGSLQNVNVDLFHGTHSISIPVYTLTSRQLSLPVSINYTVPSQPIDSVYHPGWVGHGWTVSAGGVISRTLRGTPDEKAGPVDDNFWPPYDPAQPHMEDLFTFNFCGYSGSFFYHKKRLILQSNADIIELDPIYNSNETTGFTIQLANGNLYTFGYGRMANNAEKASVEESMRIRGKDSNSRTPYISSWYLTSIESPEGDCIRFEYEYGPEICSLADQTNYSKIHAVQFYKNQEHSVHLEEGKTQEDASGTFIRPSYLKRIYSNGPVDMRFTTAIATEKGYPERYYSAKDSNFFFNEDMERIRGARWHKLTKIDLLDKENKESVFRTVDLTYYESNTEVLKLKTIKETGKKASASLSLPPYSFTYAENRDTGIEALQKMVYPTGGYVTYAYEKNEYQYGEDSQKKPLYRSTDAAGLRLRSMSSYPSAGEKPWVTTYYYVSANKDSGKSSGILSRRPFKLRRVIFSAPCNSFIAWEKNTNYDMSSFYLGAPPPSRVGYSSVFTVQSRVDNTGKINEANVHHYTYSNYNWELDPNGQRNIYPKVGQLLSFSDSEKIVKYEYCNLLDEQDPIVYANVQYLPFNYASISGCYGPTGSYTRVDTLFYRFMPEKKKISKITEYVMGSPFHESSITTLNWNKATGNLISKEVDYKYENSVYRTEYYYRCNTYHDIHHFGVRKIDEPYQVITRKDGKVIGGSHTVFKEYYSDGMVNRNFFLPWKRYSFTAKDPVSGYTATAYGADLNLSYWYHTSTHNYDTNGMLVEEQPTAQPAVSYTWDDYQRLVSVRKGNRETRYTYSVYGTTSVRGANGSVTSTEYDPLGRPTLVRDTNGHILQKTEYQSNLNP